VCAVGMDALLGLHLDIEHKLKSVLPVLLLMQIKSHFFFSSRRAALSGSILQLLHS
jgi:hypothetical protein